VLAEQPDACTFADRCPRATEVCTSSQPELTPGAHRVACWHPVRESVEV
jgi:peptide/nickel transport system ATP-binding protein